MKRAAFFLLMLPLFGAAQYKLSQQHLDYSQPKNPSETAKITYGNLRIYPIVAKDSFKAEFKNIGNYTSLKKALQQNKIAITEKSREGDVNSLYVENTSNDTIIINSGEVIKGGKQDRVVETDIVLYPRSGKKNLPVFCVEQGRWSAGSSNGNGFKGYYNYGAQSLRKVVAKEKNQRQVWNKVSEVNTKNKTVTSTHTYTALDQSPEYKKQLQQYIAYFKSSIPAVRDVVGVIVVTGNKVIGVDIFASHVLFTENFEALLHSYATEAILNGSTVSITAQAVDEYMKELLTANERKQEEVLKKKGTKLEVAGKKLKISSFD